MTRTIKRRIEALEAIAPADQYSGQNYKQVIRWEANDQIVSRYYKNGVEITQGQYEREYKPQAWEPINIIWSDPIPPRENTPEGAG